MLSRACGSCDSHNYRDPTPPLRNFRVKICSPHMSILTRAFVSSSLSPNVRALDLITNLLQLAESHIGKILIPVMIFKLFVRMLDHLQDRPQDSLLWLNELCRISTGSTSQCYNHFAGVQAVTIFFSFSHYSHKKWVRIVPALSAASLIMFSDIFILSYSQVYIFQISFKYTKSRSS